MIFWDSIFFDKNGPPQGLAPIADTRLVVRLVLYSAVSPYARIVPIWRWGGRSWGDGSPQVGIFESVFFFFFPFFIFFGPLFAIFSAFLLLFSANTWGPVGAFLSIFVICLGRLQLFGQQQ